MRLNMKLRAGLCCALVVFAGSAFAQTAVPAQASALGQAWPNVADQSLSPNWHAYVFYLNGIKFVQINDTNGTVHAAIGTTGGTTIVLPVGVDAQNVQTATSASSSSSSTTTTVYNDGQTQITATPQSDGTTQFVAADCTLVQCQGGHVAD
jgi:hypothetical protein